MLIGGANKIHFIDCVTKQFLFTYSNPEFTFITSIWIIDNDHYSCVTNVGIVEIGKREGILQSIMKSNEMLNQLMNSEAESWFHHKTKPATNISSVGQIDKDLFIFGQNSIIGTISTKYYQF